MKRQPTTIESDKAAANRRILRWSLLVFVLMFSFGFAMAPLYDTICRSLGIGGKTDRVEGAVSIEVDTSRRITVELTGNAMDGLPWEFRPLTRKIEVHPGEVANVRYYAHNTSGEKIVGQAAPSVTPGSIGEFFKKIECFCFSQQTLAAGEAREMPVQFIVDPALPPEVRTITLSYAFFNIDRAQAARFGGQAVSVDDHQEHPRHAKSGS